MKIKKLFVCVLSITLFVASMFSIHADESDVDEIVDYLISQGMISEGEILYKGIAEENNNITPYSLEEDETNEPALQVVVKTDEEIEEYFILPYIEEDGELINIVSARSSVNNESFSYTDGTILSMVFNVTYRYYSAEETNYEGPFYQPIRLSFRWDRGASGSNCTVTKIDAIYASSGLYHDVSTGKVIDKDFILKTSSISRSNPAEKTTYYGGTISMPSNAVFPLLFNDVDTYSYVHVTGTYKIGNTIESIEGRYHPFSKFVEWGEW